MSIDTNRRAYWLVVELTAEGEASEHNLETPYFDSLSVPYSKDFLSDESEWQPALRIIGGRPDQVIGVKIDDRVLAGFGSRTYPGYYMDDTEVYRSCAPLEESQAVGEVFRSIEHGDRVVLRVQGGARRYFGEEYEYIHAR